MKRRLLRAAAAAALTWPAMFLAAEGGYRLWLRHLARAAAPADAFELYVVGGSSGGGAPYGVSIAEYVSRMFDGRIGGRPIVVANVAEGGASAYPEYVALARRLGARDRSHPAAVLVYSGHNEKFSVPEERLGLHRFVRSLKRTWFWERSVVLRDLGLAVERVLEYRGIRDLDHYERYMRRTIEASLAAGAVPILSTQIGNLAGVEPGTTCDPRTFEGRRRELAELRRLERSRPAEAAGRYEALIPREPCLAAVLQYRRAKSLAAARRWDEARRGFWAAVDLDPDQHRALTAQNELLRRLAAEYRVPLVDAVAEFEAASPRGLPGADLFSDVMHPNLAGYKILGGAFARRLSEATDEPVRRPALELSELFTEGAGLRARIISGAGLLAYREAYWLDEDRLALAEAHFQEALRLDPGSFSGWLGLGLVEAERRSGLLQSPVGRRWLTSRRVFPDYQYCLPPGGAEAVADRLARAGAKPATVEKILEHRQQSFDTPFCRERLARPVRIAPEPPRASQAPAAGSQEDERCEPEVARLIMADRTSEAAAAADECVRHAAGSSARQRAQVLAQRGILWLALGRRSKALSSLDEAWKLSPEGLCEREWPRRDRIHPDFFGWCIERRPRDAGLYVDRGVSEFLLGRREEAVADFREALALDPGLQAAKDSLAAALR